ncbi:hypothetical protein [Variovorax sp. J31P207]|uniref:hypothetical protein n=1 Tax=Variovorax sp. J31P207 TaxID=3053510 RepID=UPI0025772F3A|nr:hypothetical protein [Variovorax sp. J31P207]MDM0071721.1 hypothetical protein [Variovorax sp. J31P207]
MAALRSAVQVSHAQSFANVGLSVVRRSSSSGGNQSNSGADRATAAGRADERQPAGREAKLRRQLSWVSDFASEIRLEATRLNRNPGQ